MLKKSNVGRIEVLCFVRFHIVTRSLRKIYVRRFIYVRFMLKRLVRIEWISQDQDRDLRWCFQEFGFPSRGTKAPVITVMFLSLPSRTLNPSTIFSLYPTHHLSNCPYVFPAFFFFCFLFSFSFSICNSLSTHFCSLEQISRVFNSLVEKRKE